MDKTFGRMVLERAWFSAWRFFGNWQRDATLAALSLVIGEYSYHSQHGLPATWGDGAVNLGHLIAPAAIVWLALFLWHFWLAPSALAYEAAKLAAQEPNTAPAPERRKAYVNWNAWKKFDQYTAAQGSRIIAKSDPAAGVVTNEDHTLLSLILKEIDAGNLPKKVERNEYVIPRKTLIEWAEKNDFDVSHIKKQS